MCQFCRRESKNATNVFSSILGVQSLSFLASQERLQEDTTQLLQDIDGASRSLNVMSRAASLLQCVHCCTGRMSWELSYPRKETEQCLQENKCFAVQGSPRPASKSAAALVKSPPALSVQAWATTKDAADGCLQCLRPFDSGLLDHVAPKLVPACSTATKTVDPSNS